ncbi:MAG: trigger factor [Candidatus Vogelbacteria bacterium]
MAFPIEIKKLPHSTVELRGELAVEIFESFRAAALRALGQEVKLPGFRPGHVPNDVLTREIGEETVLRRMAELALNKYYPTILTENKIDALGRPNISLTKIAKGNPLGFVITTAVHPEVTLPNYRALARETQKEVGLPLGSPTSKSEVTEEEKLKARDKHRLEMIEKIIPATMIDLPPILIEAEIATMIAEMKHEVGRMGLPFDKYLEHLKKTEADLTSEWRPQAEHRVKTGLILATIAKVEKIEAPTEELEMETKRLLEQHPQTDPARARAYLASLMINEKVFQLLESA